MARQRIDIDRHKQRAAIRKLRREDLFFMLYDAIELLPPAKLWKVVGKYLDPRSLPSDGDRATTANLLAEVRAFAKASLAGEYHDSFDVNSRNFMENSAGTVAWIADCHRLLNRCVDQARKAEPADVLQAFDIIFWPSGPNRRGPGDHLLRRRGGSVAGRRALGEDPAAVVQSPLGDGDA